MQAPTPSARARAVIALTALAAAALMSACGGGGSASTGTLQLSMTDAPSCGYDHVYVSVSQISVNQSSTASATDAGWQTITLNPAQKIDLNNLTNGVLADLGQLPLAPGKYTQMRLLLGSNTGGTLANSVVPSGGSTEYALTTPSGQQTGVKMNVDIDIAANQLADFVLDFNACRSVVRAGASGKYLLKPVVTVSPKYISAVGGYVDPSLDPATTVVSVQQAGATVRATPPDSTGKFLLAPVAPGTYDLVITSPGHATEVVTGVVVASDLVTNVNTSTTALLPPASLAGTAAGTVSVLPVPASIDATVDALQTLTMGDTIEIAGGQVDATLGTYSYALPAGAPMVAAFSTTTGTIGTFAADTPNAGKYTLSASSGGTTKPPAPISVTAGATVTTNFSFP